MGMEKRNEVHRQSRRMALCGLLSALSVVLMSLGGVIPLATFACPMLALLCLIPILCEYGGRTALLVYGVAAVLSLLLCADKEMALFYTFLGWYPVLRPRLGQVPRLLRILSKCVLFSGAMGVMYLLILYLFRLEAVVAEFSMYSPLMLASLLALGNVVFLLFDRTLGILMLVYWKKRK